MRSVHGPKKAKFIFGERKPRSGSGAKQYLVQWHEDTSAKLTGNRHEKAVCVHSWEDPAAVARFLPDGVAKYEAMKRRMGVMLPGISF